MVGHYLRVQDAATLLGVSPATVRWYAAQGWLPAYRVGRGRVFHRRFRYSDVQAVARRTGRFIPDEPQWDFTATITPDMAATYLGLSVRYLTDSGWLTPGQTLHGDELMALERQIYPKPEPNEDFEEGAAMMSMACERGLGCGPRSRHGRHGAHRGAWGEFAPADDASLLALRRAKRHLEAQKADLEDQIAELERRIAQHPDNQG
jgi:excisionase family DNA binding protein